ncbi:MAG: 4Fe-4S binding protein, partial [Bacteroidales bacterium]
LAKNVIAVDCDVDAANLYLIFPPENTIETSYISGKNAIIHQDKCIECGLCKELCQFDAINIIEGKFEIDPVSCDGCALCFRQCPSEAIEMIDSDNSKLFFGDFRNGSIIYGRLSPGEENSGKFINVVRTLAKEKSKELGIENIIIDGPPGIGCPFMSTITGVDKVIIVTEPSMSGLFDLKRTIDVAKSIMQEIYVIINKYDLNLEVTNQIKEYCLEMNIKIVACLPFDKKIVDAMINSKTIIEYNYDSDISKRIKEAYQIVFKS